jgi:mannose-6-phosphate isomerase-like protein (cupin superfamily)
VCVVPYHINYHYTAWQCIPNLQIASKNRIAMINPLGVMAIVVPLLLLSSIGVSGYNSNLSVVKYALAQQSSNKTTNTMSNMSNLAAPTTKTATTTNVTSHYPPFVADILSLVKQNNNFRKEINTADHTQVVLMSLKPGEDIGLEVHKKIDQILVFVQGSGEAIIVGKKFPIREGTLAFVPVHNFINTGKTDLKLFTTYSPPNHAAGILQKTKAETKGYVPKGAIEQEG